MNASLPTSRTPRWISTLFLVVVATGLIAGLASLSSDDAHAAPKAMSLPTIYGTVGPGYVISVKTAKGVAVKKLHAGTTYTIVVNDKSDIHNFHFAGPGINKKTSISGTAKNTRWTFKATKGTYTFKCDPHQQAMHGSITAA